ncbi:IMPACT family protein [Georgenia sp. AZ-5]|uniref:IMPACT family protein n=1 Tax=Georgenia sp. AZ-5 TaxID=3367526 RepID=UPI003754CE08
MRDLRLARGEDVVAETEVRRSRFITLLRRVEDEDAARRLVADARRRHPDARHHRSAYIVEVPGTSAVERSSDDGEPAGTAGMPMLEVLRGSGLSDVAAVVVRYFGGIKLGTGGLVRAYFGAVHAALTIAPVVRLERLRLWEVALPHGDAGRVQADLMGRGVPVTGAEYGTGAVTLTLAGPDDGTVARLLAALTSGTVTPRRGGTAVVEHPL